MKYIKALYMDSNVPGLFLVLLSISIRGFDFFTGPRAGLITSFVNLVLIALIVLLAFKGRLGKLATAGVVVSIGYSYNDYFAGYAHTILQSAIIVVGLLIGYSLLTAYKNMSTPSDEQKF